MYFHCKRLFHKMIHEIRKVTQMLNPPLSSDVKGLTKTFVEKPPTRNNLAPTELWRQLALKKHKLLSKSVFRERAPCLCWSKQHQLIFGNPNPLLKSRWWRRSRDKNNIHKYQIDIIHPCFMFFSEKGSWKTFWVCFGSWQLTTYLNNLIVLRIHGCIDGKILKMPILSWCSWLVAIQ